MSQNDYIKEHGERAFNQLLEQDGGVEAGQKTLEALGSDKLKRQWGDFERFVDSYKARSKRIQLFLQ